MKKITRLLVCVVALALALGSVSCGKNNCAQAVDKVKACLETACKGESSDSSLCSDRARLEAPGVTACAEGCSDCCKRVVLGQDDCTKILNGFSNCAHMSCK